MMEHINSIETIYNGYRFRSRLEARWAVFFDVLGIKYVYEPQGYTMKYGIRYLPDFELLNIYRRDCDSTGYKNTPLFVEVKGAYNESQISIEDKIKIENFAKERDIIVFGNIPKDLNDAYESGHDPYLFNYSFLDGDAYPCFFSIFQGNIWLGGPDHDESQEFGSEESINRALATARMARFD